VKLCRFMHYYAFSGIGPLQCCGTASRVHDSSSSGECLHSFLNHVSVIEVMSLSHESCTSQTDSDHPHLESYTPGCTSVYFFTFCTTESGNDSPSRADRIPAVTCARASAFSPALNPSTVKWSALDMLTSSSLSDSV
jgi:hypothetical protein